MSATKAKKTTQPRSLREARQAKRLTQEQLAHELGTHQNYISDLERGVRFPAPVMRRLMALFFETHIDKINSWFSAAQGKAA